MTSSISMANHSPLSSENHRSLFVKPAKRGKQRAGGEALYTLYHFTFNYQQRHPHNWFTTQLCWYCAIILMDEFHNINVLTTQLGTSCAFDSPGLPNDSAGYPGLAYDVRGTTPSVLRFLSAIHHIFWREKI